MALTIDLKTPVKKKTGGDDDVPPVLEFNEDEPSGSRDGDG